MQRSRPATCYAVAVMACMMVACTTESLVSNIYDNREYVGDNLQRPLKVSQARDTFLLKSSDIFYPDAMPQDPTMLPDLSQDELEALEELLGDVSDRVDHTLEKHREFFLKNDPEVNLDEARVRVNVLDQGHAVAGTDQTGILYLDAKVVQAIYRSALLAVLAGEDSSEGFLSSFFLGEESEIEGIESMTPEQRAFAEFDVFRHELENVSSVLLFSDLSAFSAGTDSDVREEENDFFDRMLAGSMSVVNQRMKDARLMARSRSLERAFLGSIEFLVAHEVSHIALNHFPLATECDEAQFREFRADINAVLINTLTQFDEAPSFTIRAGDDGGYKLSGALFWEPMPTHLLFFTYAYELAEFDSTFGNIANCDYLEATRRAAMLVPFANLLTDILEDARNNQVYKHSRDRKVRELVSENPFRDIYNKLLIDSEDPEDGKRLSPKSFIESNEDVLSDLYHIYYQP